MHPLKKLAEQTAVYGLSTIVGRLLNFLLVPLYTNVFPPQEYGVITELFAYAVFLQVILTYGMETGFFRFSQKNYKIDTVFSTSITSLILTSSLFLILLFVFSDSISNFLGYSDNKQYIIWLGIILVLDSITAIPFAKLRQENKAFKFVIFKLINISVNIGLNLFFLLLCKDSNILFLNNLYNPEIGVGYIFISNLVASAVTFSMFLPDFFKSKYKFDKSLYKSMLIYSLPLLISGLAGTINETLDRIVIKFWIYIPDNITDIHQFIMYQLGIYGANTKIAVFMMLFVQTFRFAADPFYFAEAKNPGFEKTFADVMKYYTILGCLIFLGIILYLDIFKHFIDEKYFDGLIIVAPLLLSRLFFGISYNLSFWYKLKDKTSAGIVIFVIGALITIILNFILIPKIGYLGCAYANLGCYTVMMLISYFWGQKVMPINYDLKRILGYIFLSVTLYFLSRLFKQEQFYINLLINTFLLSVFLIAIAYFENIKILFKELKKIMLRNGNKNSK